VNYPMLTKVFRALRGGGGSGGGEERSTGWERRRLQERGDEGRRWDLYAAALVLGFGCVGACFVICASGGNLRS